MLSEEAGEVFNVVSSPESGRAIFAELVNGKHDLALANKKIPELHALPLKIEGDKLIIQFDAGASPFTDGEKLKAYFHIGNQHYFFETQFNFHANEKNQAELPLTGALYVRQLRKQFRMVVPDGYIVEFKITKPEQLDPQCRVIDLSLNGMLVHQKSGFSPAVGTEIQGELKIGKHPGLQIAGLIRHFAGAQVAGNFGVEFSHLVFKSENRLQELLLMYRHDTFYLKKQKLVAK